MLLCHSEDPTGRGRRIWDGARLLPGAGEALAATAGRTVLAASTEREQPPHRPDVSGTVTGRWDRKGNGPLVRRSAMLLCHSEDPTGRGRRIWGGARLLPGAGEALAATARRTVLARLTEREQPWETTVQARQLRTPTQKRKREPGPKSYPGPVLSSPKGQAGWEQRPGVGPRGLSREEPFRMYSWGERMGKRRIPLAATAALDIE